MQWNFLHNVHLPLDISTKLCCDPVGTISLTGTLRNYNHCVAIQEISSEQLAVCILVKNIFY